MGSRLESGEALITPCPESATDLSLSCLCSCAAVPVELAEAVDAKRLPANAKVNESRRVSFTQLFLSAAHHPRHRCGKSPAPRVPRRCEMDSCRSGRLSQPHQLVTYRTRCRCIWL